MNGVVAVSVLFMVGPLTLLVLYQWVLAVCSFLSPLTPTLVGNRRAKFLVLIPAHNEEAGIAGTLDSCRALDYPTDQYVVVVVADRCTDRTASVARGRGATCIERIDGHSGKGAALAYGIQEARKARISFDAVVIIDADTLADRGLLTAFNARFQDGYHVQQGYNYISNPWASPFTRIIAVTGVLRNGRYYAGKAVLGLPGMLTGTGMCVATDVLDRHGWTAFSVGEDWEFSVQLLLNGVHILFNPFAKTFAKESQNLKQASQQRLRWASGRYAVMGAAALTLVKQSIRRRSYALMDAAVTLTAPNYSSQASLALVCCAVSLTIAGDPLWGFVFYWALALLALIAGYFLLGVFSTEAPARALAGMLMVPVFLPWRLTIEFLGMLGYGRRSWGKMARSARSSHQANR